MKWYILYLGLEVVSLVFHGSFGKAYPRFSAFLPLSILLVWPAMGKWHLLHMFREMYKPFFVIVMCLYCAWGAYCARVYFPDLVQFHAQSVIRPNNQRWFDYHTNPANGDFQRKAYESLGF